eukprot:gene12829-14773_t
MLHFTTGSDVPHQQSANPATEIASSTLADIDGIGDRHPMCAVEGGPTCQRRRWSIKMTADLCLYRVATRQCRGRVLPYAIREMIFTYAYGHLRP